MPCGNTSAMTTVFHRVLDPADNATGGGAACAIAGAMAAALVGMVARLSVGKGFTDMEPHYHVLGAEAETLSSELLAGANEDAAAFDALSVTYRLPKNTEAERTARSLAIQEALLHASRIPLANAERCRRVQALGHQLSGRSNISAASDLECALLLTRAALLGCLSNLETNLRSVKDEGQRASLTLQAVRLRATSDLG
jgi:formiminotetrahydrofolate cyclodeaminase